MKTTLLWMALSVLMLPLLFGCGTKKKPTDHFGTELSYPVFTGPGDLLRSAWRVNQIMVFHKLDGQPVDLSWISPAFRERLCLTVTIANHCVA